VSREASWHPRVGDRVRVCFGVGTRLNCAELPHYPEEAGRTATVHAERAWDGAPCHPFLVVFDLPAPQVCIMNNYVCMPARHYAASELEPLATESATTAHSTLLSALPTHPEPGSGQDEGEGTSSSAMKLVLAMR
jgi:hypothetical protein